MYLVKGIFFLLACTTSNIAPVSSRIFNSQLEVAAGFRRDLEDCPTFADFQSIRSDIDTSKSEIRGNIAYIVIDFPNYYGSLQADFVGKNTSTRYGWEASPSNTSQCDTSYTQSFSFQKLQNGGLTVDGQVASFWLDFKWWEPINGGPFDVFARYREILLPFTISLPPTHSLSIAVATIPRPPSVEHEIGVNDTISDDIIDFIINQTSTDLYVDIQDIVVTKVTYKFHGVIIGELQTYTPTTAPTANTRRKLWSANQLLEIENAFITELCDVHLNINQSSMELSITPNYIGNSTINVIIETDTFEAAENIQALLGVMDLNILNAAIPGFKIYEITIKSDVFAVIHMEIFYPTSNPTSSPTHFPSTYPSLPPFEGGFEKDMVVWVLHGTAQEINVVGGSEIPTVELRFITAAEQPWSLEAVTVILDEHVQSLNQFDETSTSYECGPNLNKSNCQNWRIVVEINKDCVDVGRHIRIQFDASDGIVTNTLILPIEVSGSSAFSCAEDLGSFSLTTDVLYRTESDPTWGTVAKGYLAEWVEFEITFSSGTNAIQSVTLQAFRIEPSQIGSETIMPKCTHCQHSDAYTEVFTSEPDLFQFRFHFSEDEFESTAYTLFLDFKITYDTGSTRRRLAFSLPSNGMQQRAHTFPIMFTLEEKRNKENNRDDYNGITLSKSFEYDVRFDYDCALIATNDSKALFLQECNEVVHPIICKSTKCGSIIVTFEARSRLDQGEMLARIHEDGLYLPSFGTAEVKLENHSEDSVAYNEFVAQYSFEIFIVAITGAIAMCVCILLCCSKKTENEETSPI